MLSLNLSDSIYVRSIPNRIQGCLSYSINIVIVGSQKPTSWFCLYLDFKFIIELVKCCIDRSMYLIYYIKLLIILATPQSESNQRDRANMIVA